MQDILKQYFLPFQRCDAVAGINPKARIAHGALRITWVER